MGKAGIVESVLLWSKFKADSQLKSKQSGKKTNKLKGIPKLEDANEAGTKNSSSCSLILTEGDSAKGFAMSGRAVIGAEYYGVFPLKGKLLNVREATAKTIMDNAEIGYLVKILGLTYKKKYESMSDLAALRYGKLMIMTDQDQDGSHIKGLLINFFHHNWPGLLKLPFLEEFITPIVKATKGSRVMNFYSLPEFNEWKEKNENWNTWKVKYYKGLGTSTSKEAKEYFSDMVRHKIKFKYNGDQDDHSIQLAFSKKAVDQRKEWLTNWMEEGKRRKELGLPEVYLYEKDTRAVNYTDFINKELVLFSNMDNERSIPSLVDGFKPGQRKVIFTCLKRNLTKKEIKVAQLAGSVAEVSAYHHGEASLMGTIINLAQNYVGRNNINLLQPIGQFGTRLSGGKDSASPRYIFTQLSPLARMIFNEHDDAILNTLTDDNQKIEPEFYMPILPMVLVNGADGIGTGWMTKIPNYNPREIVANLQRLIRGEEPKEMMPWFKNFKGTIERLDHQRYVINGEIATLSDTRVEITELPVKTWTNAYKETLETMLAGNEKSPAVIQDYKDYNTDKTVKFIVQLSEAKMREVETTQGLHTFFKLQTTMSTTSMVLFDHLGCLRRFENVGEILREFYVLRLEYYTKRKKYLEGLLGSEACKLSNQARFILEKCDGTLKIENKKKKIMIDELVRRGYDSDPIKAWKKSVAGCDDDEEEENNPDSQEVNERKEKGPDYDYLLGMPMWNLTQEKKDELCRKRDEKHQELEKLKATSKEQLWENDLVEFSEKLDEVEAKEAAEDAGGPNELAGKSGAKKGKAKKGTIKLEALPSAAGIRVVPRIADELKQKAAKIVAAKERKALKEEKVKKDVKDEFDKMAEVKSGKSMKQSKLTFKPKKSESSNKKDNPWSDSDESEYLSGSDKEESTVPVAPREKTEGRRAVASKAVNYDMENSATEDEILAIEDSDSETQVAKPRSKVLDLSSDKFDVSDSDDGGLSKKLAAKVGNAKKPSVPKPKQLPVPKKKSLKKKRFSESDEDNKPKKKSKPTTTKMTIDSDSVSDFDDPPPPRDKSGRSRQPVKYQGFDDSDSDF